jgi:hypothetical protein
LLIGFIVLIGFVLGSAGEFFRGGEFNARAQSVAADDKEISPQALEQIAALIREKESRNAIEQKIDSRLLYRLKMSRNQAIADGVPTLKSDLTVDERGFVEVDITANVGGKLLAALKEMRADITVVLPQYRSITASVPLLEIETLAARPEVIFVQPKMDAMTNQRPSSLPADMSLSEYGKPIDSGLFRSSSRVSFETRAQRVRQFLKGVIDHQDMIGSVTSQGDTTHRASLARTLAGVNGAGIKIGVLSDGVTSRAARQASGDLPAGLTVLPGQVGTGDEGTAMLELIYDLAPGAQLYFATAFNSITSFAQNIKDLRTAGCDIIIDDVSYFSETPFQNGQAPAVVSPTNAGVVVQAVNDVTVGSQAGALFFSSAANSGNKNDNTAGAWEGDFVNGGATGAPIPAGNNVHNFGGGVTQNVLTAGGRITLKWSDPLGGSGNDYDLYVLNSTGTAIASASSNIQSGSQDPYEDAGNCSAGQRVVIVKKAAAANRFLHLNTNRGVLTVSTSGVVYGHNAGVNTISVAATPAGPAQFNAQAIGPFPNPHTAANVVETFSSDGPRRIFYTAIGGLITPGNVSSTGGQLLQKPDITAADGTSVTQPGFIPFFGTSAAAPHAGALMALVKQSSPFSTNAQLYSAMTSTAFDIEAPGFDRDSGAGIFMPLRAMSAVGAAGPAMLEQGVITTTEASSNGNGRVEPGESANLNIPLNNIGLTTATAVSATLTTSTPGVNILIGSTPIAYPNIAAGVGTELPTSQFQFGLDDTFPCGGPISFTLTVNYAGGTAPTVVLNFTVDTAPTITISTTLDAAAPTSGSSYTASTGLQTGRLNRNGIFSDCGAAKATPPLQDNLPNRRYDAFVFTASTSGCTTVTLSTTFNNAGNNMYLAVYGNGGYNPAVVTSNYLADWGVTTGGLVTVGFDATAGQQYTVVVHEITPGSVGVGVAYTLNVTGPIVGACSFVPTAAGATVTGRVTSTNGYGIRNAIVALTGSSGQSFTARTNSFGYFRIDDVPSGSTYIATVKAKGFIFTPRSLNVLDSVDGFDLSAEP